MKSTDFVFALLGLALLACEHATTQAPDLMLPETVAWDNLQGPYMGKIFTVYISSLGTLFVGTNSTLCSSTNKGNNWQCQEKDNVMAIAENKDGNLFAGFNNGIYLSTDNGVTWHRRTGIPEGTHHAFAINSDGHIFAGRSSVSGEVLYRSKDNGYTWELVNNGLNTINIRTIVIDANGYVFAGGNAGLWRSIDNEVTWQGINKGLELSVEQPFVIVFTLAVDKHNNLFAGTQYGGGVYYSTNNGDSWTLTGLSDVTILDLEINSTGHIFAGTAHGVYRSINKGNTWESLGLEDYEVEDMDIDTDDYIFVGTQGVIHKSKFSTIINN